MTSLLFELKRDRQANKLNRLADKTIYAIEEKLWSEEGGCYMEELHPTDGSDRMLTQDIFLYLVAITENTSNDSLRLHNKGKQKKEIKQQKEKQQETESIHQKLYTRATITLDAIKSRAWKDKWPLVTEGELKKTAPWVLKPYQYRNHTF